MQETLTVIIVLLIVAVVLDGIRRMRQSRRSAIRMSRKVSQHSPAAVDDVNDYGSELPSGGARVVNVRKPDDSRERNQQIRQSAEQKRRNQLKSFRIPEQVSLNLDQKVPTLMESVGEENDQTPEREHEHEGEPAAVETPVSHDDIAGFNDDDRIEPVFSADSADVDDDEYQHSEEPGHDLDEWDRATFSDGSDDAIGKPQWQAKPKTRETETAREETAREAVREERKDGEVELAPPTAQPQSRSQSRPQSQPQPNPSPEKPTLAKPEAPKSAERYVEEDDADQREPELVLVINVMAPKGAQFPGAELLEIILSQGLRFGAMNIFHRHEEDDGEGEILYSMANIVVPGTFDLAKMKTFSTPGVSLFMTLPMDANSIDAFEDMLTTAKIIAARLDGELKDENRSVLTPQTITHYRSKLQEFVRKQLSKAPA